MAPALRAGAGRGVHAGSRLGARDTTASVYITNLPAEADEADLHELCRPFGPLRSVKLVRDRRTNQSKGFAFVNFRRREDADGAIQRLDGYAYGHLVMRVQWARPRGGGPGGGTERPAAVPASRGPTGGTRDPTYTGTRGPTYTGMPTGMPRSTRKADLKRAKSERRAERERAAAVAMVQLDAGRQLVAAARRASSARQRALVDSAVALARRLRDDPTGKEQCASLCAVGAGLVREGASCSEVANVLCEVYNKSAITDEAVDSWRKAARWRRAEDEAGRASFDAGVQKFVQWLRDDDDDAAGSIDEDEALLVVAGNFSNFKFSKQFDGSFFSRRTSCGTDYSGS